MAASSTDKFAKVIAGTTRPVATTLSAQKLVGATSCTVQATTGWATDTIVHGIMYRVDASNNKVAGSQIDWKGIVSGTSITNFSVTAGTDDTYEVGTVVELSPTASWGTKIAEGMLVEHKQTGAHGDVTADSVTVANNIKVADTKSIVDGNSNELIKFSQTASAVNEVTVKNAATANAPQIQASGGDTNIDVSILGKGTGQVKANGNPVLTLVGIGTGSGATLTTSYVDHASVTATSGGNKVLIEWGAKVGNGASGATRNFDVQVLCDGVTTSITPSTLNYEAIFVSGANTNLFYGYLHVHDAPSAGSHTWKLQFKASIGSAVVLANNYIKVTEVA